MPWRHFTPSHIGEGEMSVRHGQFVWYELLCDDARAAVAFYTTVIGWTAGESGLTDRSFTILSAGGAPVAGLMELPKAARGDGARPFWSGYVGVDDVDATIARLKAAGGSVHRDAESLDGVGRFAVVADPQGAVFVVFTPAESRADARAALGPGQVGWHELYAGAGESAFGFYADLFGWTKAQAIDLGPMGTYQCFASADAAVGGIMTKPPTVSSPGWIYYFVVDELGAAIERASNAGGTILNGPHQVPGGSWVAQALDPQGAIFAMVGPSM